MKNDATYCPPAGRCEDGHMTERRKGGRSPLVTGPIYDRRIKEMPPGLTEKQYLVWLTYRKHAHPADLAQMLEDVA